MNICSSSPRSIDHSSPSSSFTVADASPLRYSSRIASKNAARPNRALSPSKTIIPSSLRSSTSRNRSSSTTSRRIVSGKSDSASRRVSGMSSSVIADRIFREHQYELPHMIDPPRVDSGLGMFERRQQLRTHPSAEQLAPPELDQGPFEH